MKVVLRLSCAKGIAHNLSTAGDRFGGQTEQDGSGDVRHA